MSEPRGTDTLWLAWEEILRGRTPEGGDLDPTLVTTIRQLLGVDRVPPPDPARMRAVRQELTGGLLRRPPPNPPPAGGAPAAQSVIRILIVEREPLFRRGLAGCLGSEQRMQVLGSGATAEEGYRLADEHLPDVLLVGTTLSDAPGLAAATEFRRHFPSIATIVLAAQESDDELFAAIRAGASAYCGQDIDEKTLVAIIKRAATGEYVINEQLLDKPYVAARVLEQFRSATLSDLAPTSAFAPLTDRELEILRKVGDGLTNAEIAYNFGISAQTVKNHVTSILRKLAVNDRTQAVVTALKRGWLAIEGVDPARVVDPDDDASASSVPKRR